MAEASICRSLPRRCLGAIDRVLEVEAIRLYEEAAAYCGRVRDFAHHGLFAGILRDELMHLDELGKMEADLPQQEPRYA